jgi:hypothetical protein
MSFRRPDSVNQGRNGAKIPAIDLLPVASSMKLSEVGNATLMNRVTLITMVMRPKENTPHSATF